MQNADRFVNGWRVLVARVMRVVHHAPRWLLPAIVLALALGLGTPFQSSVVQAQDGGSQTGQEATVSYQLAVDTGSLNLDRFCAGRIVELPVNVRRNVQVAGNPNAGRARVLGVNYGASS